MCLSTVHGLPPASRASSAFVFPTTQCATGASRGVSLSA